MESVIAQLTELVARAGEQAQLVQQWPRKVLARERIPVDEPLDLQPLQHSAARRLRQPARGRHFPDGHVAQVRLGHKVRSQRVRRKPAFQTRRRATRLHDEPHAFGAQWRAHAVARQRAPEDRTGGDSASTARTLRTMFFDVGGQGAIVVQRIGPRVPGRLQTLGDECRKPRSARRSVRVPKILASFRLNGPVWPDLYNRCTPHDMYGGAPLAVKNAMGPLLACRGSERCSVQYLALCFENTGPLCLCRTNVFAGSEQCLSAAPDQGAAHTPGASSCERSLLGNPTGKWSRRLACQV
ncbi:hypothetical protein RCH10_005581 [Variovorax sp. GrIS 2.14]